MFWGFGKINANIFMWSNSTPACPCPELLECSVIAQVPGSPVYITGLDLGCLSLGCG